MMFFLELDTRVAHLAGITTSPSAPRPPTRPEICWRTSNGRYRLVIHDGASQCTRSFTTCSRPSGKAITTPPTAADTNQQITSMSGPCH